MGRLHKLDGLMVVESGMGVGGVRCFVVVVLGMGGSCSLAVALPDVSVFGWSLLWLLGMLVLGRLVVGAG